MNPKGTPKTLIEAIRNGLNEGANYSDTHTEATIKAHIKDFLAQHFCKPMVKASSPEESARFKALFDRLIATRIEICEHTDKDKHNSCLDCGANCHEEVMTSANEDTGKHV